MHPRFDSSKQFDDILAGHAVLKIGDRGQAVAVLQEALRDMGFPMLVLKSDVGVSGVDGVFGSQTETAVRNFQVHAQSKHPDVPLNGIVDGATMRSLVRLVPSVGKKSWQAGEPNHAPKARWSQEPTIRLRVVVVKDEHRTFLFDTGGICIGIFPNAHGTQGSNTDTGLKKIQTKLGEADAKAAGKEKWANERAFGKRIIDLSWASGAAHGEELHGTYDYRTMGRNVSHGCIRHYNEDIVAIFDAVRIGDYVAVVDSINSPELT